MGYVVDEYFVFYVVFFLVMRGNFYFFFFGKIVLYFSNFKCVYILVKCFIMVVCLNKLKSYLFSYVVC